FCVPGPRTPVCSPLSLHDALPIFRGETQRGHGPQIDLRVWLMGSALLPADDVIHKAGDPGRLHKTADGFLIRGGGNGHPKTPPVDRKSTRLNSSHVSISYAVFCLK